ncbi:hypothetical protein FKM82_022870 [Ascaphus truei]
MFCQSGALGVTSHFWICSRYRVKGQVIHSYKYNYISEQGIYYMQGISHFSRIVTMECLGWRPDWNWLGVFVLV